MLLDTMVGQDPATSPKVEDLASISEVPVDVPGELMFFEEYAYLSVNPNKTSCPERGLEEGVQRPI